MKSKNDESVSKVARLERFGIFAAFMLFPILFLAAQLLHPNLFHSSPIADGRTGLKIFVAALSSLRPRLESSALHCL